MFFTLLHKLLHTAHDLLKNFNFNPIVMRRKESQLKLIGNQDANSTDNKSSKPATRSIIIVIAVVIINNYAIVFFNILFALRISFVFSRPTKVKKVEN